jgi:transcriptional regulator with XRE-family HTH domain
MLEIGSSLREARSQQGLTLADVEGATMIRARYLDALEDERFDLLPAGAYRRSFLREYASALGLDPDVYASEYELRLEAPEPERPPARRRGRTRLAELPLARILAIVAAVVLVGAGVWRLNESGTSPGSNPRSPPATPRPRAQHRPSTHPPTTAQARGKPAAPLVLSAAGGSCWLLVRIGSSLGPTVYERTLQQGQTVRFGLRKPLWIRLGAPWNLKATIGRRPVTASLPPSTGDIFATTSGLRSTA